MTHNSHKQAPEHLKQFQASFSNSLRNLDVAHNADAPPRAATIYEQLLFNNLCGFIDKCYPVSQSLVTDETWLALKKTFYKTWRCHSPLFQKIPFEFYEYIAAHVATLDVPEFLPQLMHYEWLELEIDLKNASVSKPKASYNETSKLSPNPTLHTAHYQWPVHKICVDFIPEQMQETHLLIFRDHTHDVRFIEINALTEALVQHVVLNPNHDITTTLTQFAAEQTQLEDELVIHFGKQLIIDLIAQNALIVAN